MRKTKRAICLKSDHDLNISFFVYFIRCAATIFIKMASSSTKSGKQPNKRQRLCGTNDQIGNNGPVPIRTVCIHGITRDVSNNKKSTFKILQKWNSNCHK